MIWGHCQLHTAVAVTTSTNASSVSKESLLETTRRTRLIHESRSLVVDACAFCGPLSQRDIRHWTDQVSMPAVLVTRPTVLQNSPILP